MQAESLWLHLGIIKELAAMCHTVFQGGDVRYGYTTVPTYPRWVCLPHLHQDGLSIHYSATQLHAELTFFRRLRMPYAKRSGIA